MSKITIKKSQFNFVLNIVSLKRKKRKKIDFLIYYRRHNNKKYLFPYSLIEKIIKLKFKISIIGDKLHFPLVKNYGKISNKKVWCCNKVFLRGICMWKNIHRKDKAFCIKRCIKYWWTWKKGSWEILGEEIYSLSTGYIYFKL